MIPLGYGPGLESRPPVGLDPRTGLEIRNTSGVDSRSVGMEPRSVGMGVEMRDAVADREEVVISTLSWPPDQQDNVNQGMLDFEYCNDSEDDATTAHHLCIQTAF